MSRERVTGEQVERNLSAAQSHTCHERAVSRERVTGEQVERNLSAEQSHTCHERAVSRERVTGEAGGEELECSTVTHLS